MTDGATREGEGAPGGPEVSVIVAAHNAAETIGRTLEALAAQDAAADSFEVIVVDDGSTDDTAAISAAAPGRAVRLIRRARGGPGEARNTGVAAAAGSILAFTDADCMPGPSWVREGLAAIERADLVQGLVRADSDAGIGPFDRTLWVLADNGLYQTANLWTRREAFEAAGGFEQIVFPGDDSRGHFGEDVLLGWKLRRAGARALFAPEVVVEHAVFARGPAGLIAERARLAYFPELVRRVPELRSEFLHGGVFLSPRTARFDLALAGVTAALLNGRRSLRLVGIAALVPYLAAVAGEARNWGGRAPLVAASGLLADLRGAAALAEGSVRSGSPVL